MKHRTYLYLMTVVHSFMRSVIPVAQPVDGGAVEQFKTGLLDAVTQEKDGSISMKIRLPDAAAIEELVAKRSTGTDAYLIDIAMYIFIICWLIGIIDSYRVGRARDKTDSAQKMKSN